MECSQLCGILGVFSRPDGQVSLNDALTALDTIRHRGPDDEGRLLLGPSLDGGIPCGGSDTDPRLGLPTATQFIGQPLRGFLGHRRLSIIDLSPAGHQPMSDPEGRYWIVYNGEVYNYIELREELAIKGHVFRTGTDTEVVLAAYREWGPEMLRRFVGMFAIAIVDLASHSLFLARDFFGIKPLYYTLGHDGFAFASEIKALLALPGTQRKVNPERLYHYLRFSITDHADQTLYSSVRQLPAAHYAVLDLDSPDSIQPKRYWDPGTTERTDLSFDDAARLLGEEFSSSCKLHLRSDVPVGACLSGGIDSSAIVMTLRQLKGRPLDMHSFSFIGGDPSVDEEQYMDLIAGASGSVPHKTRPTPQELVQDLDDLIRLQDEPFGTTSIYAQNRVFRLVAESGIKVMLDGQGADEMMAGYRPYLAGRLASLLSQWRMVSAASFLRETSRLPDASVSSIIAEAAGHILPGWLQGPLRSVVGKDMVPDWLNESWFRDRGVQSFGITRTRIPGRALRAQLYDATMNLSLPMLLRYEDRNSMHYSIESRVPFLTPKIAELAMSLPEDYLIDSRCNTKAVLRAAMRGVVPDTVLDRRDKIGFATPESKWLEVIKPWVDGVLADTDSSAIPAIGMPLVRKQWAEIAAGRRAFDSLVWRWINVIRWAQLRGIDFS